MKVKHGDKTKEVDKLSRRRNCSGNRMVGDESYIVNELSGFRSAWRTLYSLPGPLPCSQNPSSVAY